jgi:hypothetical protein
VVHQILTDEMIKNFILLNKLDKKQRELLISELRTAKPAISPKIIAKQIDNKVGLDLADLEKLISYLFRLYSCRRQNKHKTEECADAIINKMQTTMAIKPKINNNFRGFLQALLQIDQSIGISEKALDLAMAHDKLTIGLKIYTDIRPSFSTPIENSRIAALILHKFEITYLENGKKNKSYFTVDSDDLSELKSIIERAESKEKRIRNMDELKNIHFFEFPKE